MLIIKSVIECTEIWLSQDNTKFKVFYSIL